MRAPVPAFPPFSRSIAALLAAGADLGRDGATCLGFFSRLPLPRGVSPRPFGVAIRVLPLAGLLIGACTALPLWGGVLAGLPRPACALLGTAAGLLATGALHEDGLADTADGLGGGRGRARKLDIMRDSRIGTYGVLAVTVALLWRVNALAVLLDGNGAPSVALLVLAAAALSRALALLPLVLLPPARQDGLGRGVGPLDANALAVCFGLAAVLGAAGPLLAGAGLGHALLACGLALAAAGGVTHLARSQIGGFTGDIAGAAQQAAEAAFWLGLLAFPPLSPALGGA